MIHVPYHVHSVYSILDSSLRLEDYVAWGVANNMPYLFLSDHGTMSGAYTFYNLCLGANIKPVIGVEFYICDFPKDRSNYHIVLTAKNKNGFKEIIRLNNEAVRDNFYHKPRLKNEWLLSKKIENIIISTACIRSEVAQFVLHKENNKAEELLVKYYNVYGDDFYLELQFNELIEQHKVNEFYMAMAEKHSMNTVIGSDVHYLDAHDHEVQSVMHDIRNVSAKTRKGWRDEVSCKELYLKSLSELLQCLHKWKFKITQKMFMGSVNAVHAIANKCDIKFDSTFKYPPISNSIDPTKLFQKLCKEGLLKKYATKQLDYCDHEKHVARMVMEIDALKREKFITMFLIIHDLIQRCKEHDIWVGPGRGSVVGVFCSYLIGVTALNPLKYNLLFERFCPLTEGGRVTPPDIDVDFEDRDRTMDIIRDTYGTNNVLSVGNFTYYKPRSTIIDLLRIRGVAPNTYYQYSKNYDNKLSIEDNFKTYKLKRFKNEYKAEYKMFMRLMTTIKQLGKHAAAVIILPDNELLPICKNADAIITQYNGKALEAHGYAKLDCLKLDNLAIIKNAVKLAGIDFDINNVALDDPNVYKMFDAGNTIGVFQFDAPHTVEILRKIPVTCFDDLMNVNALIRPGLEIDKFVRNCNNLNTIAYLPGTEEIYCESKGVLLYQEQVMRLCTDVAGFSLYDADKIRKIIAKKTGALEEKKIQFLNGAVANGYDVSVIEKLWESIEQCGGYIFNKSHACAYSYISYICMWFKYYYPVEFLASCLRYKDNNVALKFIKEARRLDIGVVYPDVNWSDVETTSKDGRIFLGLTSIKGVKKIATKIKSDPRVYETLDGFENRVVVPKGALEVLAKVGAFRSIEPNNAAATKQVIEIVKNRKSKKKKLVSMFETEKEIIADYSLDSKLMFQIEYLGHTEISTEFDLHRKELDAVGVKSIGDFLDDSNKAFVCGFIFDINIQKTKKGDEYYVVDLYDYYDHIEIMVWNNYVEQYDALLKIGKKVVVKLESQSSFGRPTLANSDGVKVYGFSDFLVKFKK